MANPVSRVQAGVPEESDHWPIGIDNSAPGGQCTLRTDRRQLSANCGQWGT
jgi:hypothetical protein